MDMTALVRLILWAWLSVYPPNLVVKTKLGYLRGIEGESRSGQNYSAFLGIQYGVVGTRFQPAELVTKAWSGIKDVRAFGTSCPQLNAQTKKPIGDENCLSLNVYVPSRKAEKHRMNRPVLVFIHGGAWFRGSSANVGPKYFMDEDLILVTINYRLGPFGFLAVRNSRAPGNIGLRDQALALEWVRDNIAAFGGDKDRLTIMGQSAGSASVAHLVTSPLTKGLFHGAILQSAATMNPWTWRTIDDAESQAFRLGQKLGCNTTDSNLLIDCLLLKDVAEILKAQEEFAKFFTDPLVPFMPVVDKSDPLAFLPENPPEVLREGGFNRVPMIVTYCQDEGLLLYAAGINKMVELMRGLDQNWTHTAGIQMMLDEDGRLAHLTSEKKEELMGDLRRHYFGQEELKANDRPTMFKLSALYTDRLFSYGIRETALEMSAHAPVYVGVFTPVGADSVTRTLGYNETLGVAHTDDLQFFFDNFGFGPFPLSPNLTEYSRNLVKLWTNFVYTGVPSATISGSEFTWAKVTNEERKSRKLNLLDLGNIPRPLVDSKGEQLRIWDNFYARFGGRKL